MEPNFEKENLQKKAMGASSKGSDDSVKSRIVDRVKDQMARDPLGSDIDPTGTNMYLKAPDWP